MSCEYLPTMLGMVGMAGVRFDLAGCAVTPPRGYMPASLRDFSAGVALLAFLGFEEGVGEFDFAGRGCGAGRINGGGVGFVEADA